MTLMQMMYVYGTIIGYSPLLLSLLSLDGGAKTTTTIAMGNSPSNNHWDRHSTLLGMGYIEEDGGVGLSWCRRKGQR
jgi:hypothetical protein